MQPVRRDLAVNYAIQRPEPVAPVRGAIAAPAAPARPRVGLGVRASPSSAQASTTSLPTT